MTTEQVILPERISGEPQVFEGTADLHDLAGLADTLANADGELRYRVEARLDPQRRKVVSCIIEGFVFLTCQSSLEAFRHEISIDDKLVLVDSENQLPPIEEEQDHEDYVVADGEIHVLDLVEEAVLLALPMVPRKPGTNLAESGGPRAGTRESPFAALERLRKKPE
ncbi:MAG: DUF177 domain-containing protein [Burkholderiales bacterium]|nr:DUF177 domain-containing protein [Burkholderiales bacterium]